MASVTTTPFHLVLFSAALAELAKSIPVLSLILSFHLFFLLPSLFPFIVLCRIVFSKPEDLKSDIAKPLSCLFLDQGWEFIIFFNGYSDLFAHLLIGNMVLVRNVKKHLIASQRPMFSSLTKRCQSPGFTGIQKYGNDKRALQLHL